MPDCEWTEPEVRLYLTGRYRLRPAGEVVVLQAEEATKYPQAPYRRWRDVSPQDVMSMVAVEMAPISLKIGTA